MSAIAQTSGPVGSAGNRRPRVLYFIIRYPEFSETYMHEEMRSVRSKQLLTGAWAASLRRADSPGQPVTRR